MGAVSPGNLQSLNLYAYCFNDPLNRTDPDGLDGGASAVIVIVVIAVLDALRTLFGGKKARTAPIIKKVTFRETEQVSNRSVWTETAIQAGVGAVSNFINNSNNKGRDVRKIRRDFYRLYGKLFNDCIKKVFGADASKVAKQTIKNTSRIDGALNEVDLAKKNPHTGLTTLAGINEPTLGKNGTVYIAADTLNSKGSNALKAIYGTYAHEKGNILDAKINNPTGGIQGGHGRPYEQTYGDPNRANSNTNDKDTDTGSAIERCIFGSLQFP